MTTRTGPLMTLWRRGRFELLHWTDRRMWKMLPGRHTYWHGELVPWCWLSLELVVDNRKDWFGDMCGTSDWPKTARPPEGGGAS